MEPLLWMTLALLALPLGFVAAELVARALVRIRGRAYVWPPHGRSRLELATEVFPTLDPVVRIEFNADGERGGPVPAPSEDCARVLVAGGSAAEGYLLDQDVNWPAVVERGLGEEGARTAFGAPRVHVGNVSRSLVSCEYIRRILGRIMPRYARLDAVLLMVGASDVVYWLEQGCPDTLEEGRLGDNYVFEEHAGEAFAWKLRKLALWRIASRLNRKLRRPVTVRTRAGKRVAELRKMRANAERLVDEVPDPRPLLDYFRKHFRALLEEARAGSRRVVVVRQPWFCRQPTEEEASFMWNFGQGRPYEEQVKVYYTHRVVNELLGRVDAEAQALCDELGVEQVDLRQHLVPSRETFYDYLHFTPEGARRVGEQVTAALLRRKPGTEGEAQPAAEVDPRLEGPQPRPRPSVNLTR